MLEIWSSLILLILIEVTDIGYVIILIGFPIMIFLSFCFEPNFAPLLTKTLDQLEKADYQLMQILYFLQLVHTQGKF